MSSVNLVNILGVILNFGGVTSPRTNSKHGLAVGLYRAYL